MLTGLSVLNTGALCGLGGLSLRLGQRRHEADQRVTDGLLHRVLGRAVEREVVDHSADDHAARINSRIVSTTSS